MNEGLTAMANMAAGPVAWVLIHSVWLGGLIAIVLALTLNFLRHRSPHVRYVIACLALLVIMPMSISLVAYDAISNSLALHSSAVHISATSANPTLTTPADRNDPGSRSETERYAGVGRMAATPWII